VVAALADLVLPRTCAGCALPGPVLCRRCAALRTRGRDHVRELTRAAVAELRAAGVPAAESRLLRRRGRVHDSAGLSSAQRRANLAGTFLVDPRRPRPGPGALMVLVDDVVTSGATLTEAAGVLAGAAPRGALPVVAAVVAATPRVARRPSAARDRAIGANGTGTASRPPLDRLSGPELRD
jgi:hypothetical protein